MIKKITILLFFFILGVFHSQTLHLYGGSNHDEYLGCLNCDSYNKNSIWNEYGNYGSSYSSKSIWNDYGTYGSSYSSYSPWNEYASTPPVIVDNDGNFYGYFTVNNYKSKRSELKLALILYKYHDFIKKDINGWYEKLFN